MAADDPDDTVRLARLRRASLKVDPVGKANQRWRPPLAIVLLVVIAGITAAGLILRPFSTHRTRPPEPNAQLALSAPSAPAEPAPMSPAESLPAPFRNPPAPAHSAPTLTGPAVPDSSSEITGKAIRTASETEILATQSQTLSEFRLDANPDIVVLVFPSMHEQAQMLLRVAALIEIRGMPRDRIMDLSELDAAIHERKSDWDSFYLGHDYRAADIGRFFDIAERTGARLTAEEETLHRIAGRQGWLATNARGALISIPGKMPNGDAPARAAILHHELSHGEYFTNPDYAAFSLSFWSGQLSEAERKTFRHFLASQEYDSSNPDLMINETQAYLIHTSSDLFFRPAAVDMTMERARQLRATFRAGMPPGWLKDQTPP